MRIRIHRNNNVSFVRDTGDGEHIERGGGFFTKEKSIGLERCPMCGLENYAFNVLSGQCAWCGFEANKIDFE